MQPAVILLWNTRFISFFLHIRESSSMVSNTKLHTVRNTRAQTGCSEVLYLIVNTHSLSELLACSMHLIPGWYCDMWCVSTRFTMLTFFFFFSHHRCCKNRNKKPTDSYFTRCLVFSCVESLMLSFMEGVHAFLSKRILSYSWMYGCGMQYAWVGRNRSWLLATYLAKETSMLRAAVRSSQTAMLSTWICNWHILCTYSSSTCLMHKHSFT